jgi:hypothetical protein
MEALLEILIGNPHLPTTKYFVPGGTKVAGGGVSFPMEITHGLIAFFVLLLGSWLDCIFTGICCYFVFM